MVTQQMWYGNDWFIICVCIIVLVLNWFNYFEKFQVFSQYYINCWIKWNDSKKLDFSIICKIFFQLAMAAANVLVGWKVNYFNTEKRTYQQQYRYPKFHMWKCHLVNIVECIVRVQVESVVDNCLVMKSCWY